MASRKVAYWDPYSIPYIQLHFIQLYRNILAFVAIYVGDTQICLSFSPELASSACTSIETCIKDIFTWMIGNKLSVNPNKTEYLLFN